ncbi:MAG TPA: ABC transporter substrate-binding protein [Acidobacteriota bacterium]|nr:ABC transporter substrate-binding protein [Acidobacteriota bacterium]
MRNFNYLLRIFTIVLLLGLPARARAGEPTAQLSGTINQFVAILVNTPVAELQATGLPDKALQLIYGRFDFSEMTKRSLGKYWNMLGHAEQKEFVDAFTNRLLYAYGRSVRASGDERIEYKHETIDDKYANVETKVVSGNGEELPIDYHLFAVDGQWKVYDMVIDQVSIVGNYRAQFERIIAKSSLKDLLERMKQQIS